MKPWQENSYKPTVQKGKIIDTPQGKLTEKTYELYKQLAERAANEYGYTIFMTDGYRSAEEQKALYAQGRTKPGQVVTYVDGYNTISDHQLGIAFDIAFRGDHLYPADQKVWDNVGKIGMELGLKWGRNEWKWDKPHFRYEPDRGGEKKEEVAKVEQSIFDAYVSGRSDIDPQLFKDAEAEYKIKKEVIVCMAVADTSLGKNLKTPYNITNLGNHDDGTTRDFGSYKEAIDETANVLANSEKFATYTIVGELSCGGRTRLGWEVCKPKPGEGYYWALSPENRQNNMDICLGDLLGEKKEYHNFTYKL